MGAVFRPDAFIRIFKTLLVCSLAGTWERSEWKEADTSIILQELNVIYLVQGHSAGAG